jgi:hypothetical protein
MINGMNQMRDRMSTGRPGLPEEKLVKLLFYKLKGVSNNKVAKRLDIASATVNKYWKMYEDGEIEESIVEKAKNSIDLVNNVGRVASNMGVRDDLTPAVNPEHDSLLPIDEIINTAALARIFNTAIKQASGDFIEEEITGHVVQASNNPAGLKSKFGFVLDESEKMIVKLKRTPPSAKNLTALIEYFKTNGIDVLAGAKKEMGIDVGDTTIDMTKLTAEEAGSAYQQLMNGDNDD